LYIVSPGGGSIILSDVDLVVGIIGAVDSSSLTSAGTFATFSTSILGQLGIGFLGWSRLVVGGVVGFLLAGAWLVVVLRLVLVMSLNSLAWSWSS
jgi:hypothetical protein